MKTLKTYLLKESNTTLKVCAKKLTKTYLKSLGYKQKEMSSVFDALDKWIQKYDIKEYNVYDSWNCDELYCIGLRDSNKYDYIEISPAEFHDYSVDAYYDKEFFLLTDNCDIDILCVKDGVDVNKFIEEF